jgi:hypothetical protein
VCDAEVMGRTRAGVEPATYMKNCPHHGPTQFLVSTSRCRLCNNRWSPQSKKHMEEREIYRGEPCFICERPMDPPCFDEADGVFRGWLCDHCNKGLGHFRHDFDVLERASAYMMGKWARERVLEANYFRDARASMDADMIEAGEKPTVRTKERAVNAAIEWKQEQARIKAEVDLERTRRRRRRNRRG